MAAASSDGGPTGTGSHRRIKVILNLRGLDLRNWPRCVTPVLKQETKVRSEKDLRPVAGDPHCGAGAQTTVALTIRTFTANTSCCSN